MTHLLPPFALGGVSALVENFEDGTFAPSGSVVPLNGNPEAFLAPDSPLPTIVAYYDALDCVEPEVDYVGLFLVTITFIALTTFVLSIIVKLFKGHYLHNGLKMFLELVLFLFASFFSIFFVLVFISPADDFFYLSFSFDGSESLLFDPLEKGDNKGQ